MQDVESTVHVESNGFDEAEAREYVNQSKLVVDRAASALILRMEFPRGGRQRGVLKVKAPSRLQVRVEGSAALKVSNVSGLEVEGTRGEATFRQIAGRVDISHRGGEVEIEDVGAVEFVGRSGTLKVAGVKGDTSIRMEQGGEVTASRLTGSVDVEGRNCDIGLDDLSTTTGPVRVNVNGGSLKVRGLKSDTRIDSRNAEVEVTMAAPAPVAIYSNGERVSLTPPPGAATRSTRASRTAGSRPTISSRAWGSPPPNPSDSEQSVSGAIKGGGPTISIRATNADFTMRTPDDKQKTDEKPAPEKLEKELKAR